MAPRLRSQPYAPDSPNNAQGLPDPAPRRRRATRSASAQPQEAETAQSVSESQPTDAAEFKQAPKTRKTRGKTSTRGKKAKTVTSGALTQTTNVKVESPNVALGSCQKQDTPYRTNVDEPEVDQMHGVEASESQCASDEPNADKYATEQSRPDTEMQDAVVSALAKPAVEIPVTVLPSVETGDLELITSTAGGCESPNSFYSLCSSHASFYSFGPPSVMSAISTLTNSSGSTMSTSSADSCNHPRWWLMAHLRSLYQLCTHSHGAPIVVPFVPITAVAVGWPLDLPVLTPNMGPSESALNDIELISICAVRSTLTASTRRVRRGAGASPSTSSEQSRVLRPQQASPIHRSRTSYADRSNSRRTESRGSFGRTLYRLPQLLAGLQNDSGEETPPEDTYDFVDHPPATPVPATPVPLTPERAAPATPVAPMTAPAARADVSPGWSRWIFNSVSRRWTVLRGRFSTQQDNETDSADPAYAASTAPASPAEAIPAATPSLSVPVSPAEVTSSTIPVPSLVPSAPSAGTNALKSPSVETARRMDVQHRPISRPRRHTRSFVDSHTLVGPGETTGAARRAAAAAALAAPRPTYSFSPPRYSPELLASCFERATTKPNTENLPAHLGGALASQIATADQGDPRNEVPSIIPAAEIDPGKPTPAKWMAGNETERAAATSNLNANQLNPRKRNRGFGLDEDELAISEDDFTPEEWKVLKAQVEKAEELAAEKAKKDAEENAPPAKKRRVDEIPQQKQRIRQPVRRQTPGTSRDTLPPHRSPGFIPNRRGTFMPPDLSPIESSGLLTDPDSSQISQTPKAPTSLPQTNQESRPAAQNNSASRSQNISELQYPSNTQVSESDRGPLGMFINGSFVRRGQLPNVDMSTQGSWRMTPTDYHPELVINTPESYEPYLSNFHDAAARLRQRKAKAAAERSRQISREENPYTRDSDAPVPYVPGVLPVHSEPPRYSTVQAFTEAYLTATSPPPSPPTFPAQRRPGFKRVPTGTFEAPNPCSSSSSSSSSSCSASPPSSPPARPVPDSSSTPSLPQRRPGFRRNDAEPEDAGGDEEESNGPVGSRAAYPLSPDAMDISPNPSASAAVADRSNQDTAATHDADTDTDTDADDIEGPSPLTRARNKAEQFKPKTPSRLRESTRFPISNASTPSAVGSSPSFNGVSTSTIPYLSDPMSVDGSSFVANLDATSAMTPAVTTDPNSTVHRPTCGLRRDPSWNPPPAVKPSNPPSNPAAIDPTGAAVKDAINEALKGTADDVGWLSRALPNGDFSQLKWPPRRSLAEALGVCPEAARIVEENWKEPKAGEAVRYFETLFKAYQENPDEFVAEL
ncbi:uncharacterized protein N7482_000456 [Penicillium canariense]|uniref:Uncharacterized protein n=1 Tax=Penicillium canariense TaxID=189055 RepID=A0A9W9IBM4_9EURO|nr:uncharacterized protein N7482_000456 [Penicillium canariense]KAJ5174579.1 hypothetical protein N7482_000456 [Penicillium canariense]